jgi:glutamate carboxypeptidase
MNLPSQEELLEGITSWVEIESHTTDRDGVNRAMDAAEAQFRRAGAIVKRIPGTQGYADCLSASSSWGGDEPGILVLSHLDTVHPKGTLETFPFRIDGDRAYGPGILDMKGGAYLGLAAYESLVGDGVTTPLPVRFLIVSDEEVGSPSSRALIEKAGEKAKYVVVTEAARTNGEAVTARRGSARYRITAHGRASHSGSAHSEGRSAIRELARHVLAVEDRTDYGRNLSLNVGRMQGGTADNTVPETCFATVDLRVASMADFEEIDTFIRGLKPHDPDIRLEVTGRLNRPPYQKNPGIQSLYEHTKAVAAEVGFELGEIAAGGGSDGNFLADRIPTIDGIGVRGGGAHTLGEYMEISCLIPRLRFMRRIMETLT